MAIKISGSTIIDDSRNIQNVGVITATTINVGSAITISNTGEIIAQSLRLGGNNEITSPGIGISLSGLDIGSSITKLNFSGVGISTITKNGNIANIILSFDKISELPSLPE